MKHEVDLKNYNGERPIVLEIREGAALPLKEPKALTIAGNYDSVSRFIINRNIDSKVILEKSSHIEVDREKQVICLIIDETNHYTGSITGKLDFTDVFKKFEINTGVQRTTFELSDFIKMNRSCFENPSVAANLVTLLRNFKAKVERDLENSDDNRGNKNIKIRQIVDSNIPESFKVVIPIFKGLDPIKIDVEVNIDADNFCCTLISPHAAELIQNSVRELFDLEIERIKGISDILIIEK